MTIHEMLEDIDLNDGESIRADCPSCRGRNTLTISKVDSRVVWNCYKASCSIKGGKLQAMSYMDIAKKLSKEERYVKQEKEQWVPPEYVVLPTHEHTKLHRFLKRYGIAMGQAMYDVKDERAVFPIYQDGKLVDATGRALGDKLPKWYRYTGAADHYVIGDGDTILVVEDVISAIVAAQEFPYVTAMALLGTNLSNKNIAKIGEYKSAIVALDPDARDKTLQFKRNIELWTGLKTTALSLHDDIKYRREEDMENLWSMTS